jgi:uncharacterized protein
MSMFKAAVYALIFSSAVVGSLIAGPFEGGSDAWDRGDYATAASLFRPLADRGDARAAVKLGLMYQQGRGVPVDYPEAANWFGRGADRGNADAQKNLGFMFLYGRGVRRDYVSAHMWFHLAASSGNKSAAFAQDLVAAKMTPDEVAEAEKLAEEWELK